MDSEDTTMEDWQDISAVAAPDLDSEIRTSFDQQRLCLYILTQRDRPIPSLESMKQFLDSSPEDSVDTRIAELSEQCSEDLDRLYTASAEDYIEEAEDRFYSFDEGFESSEDLKALQSSLRCKKTNHQTEWDLVADHTVATFRLQMEELQTLAELQELFIAQPSNFPQTIKEYRDKPKDMQARVARFLVLASEDDEQRQSMLTQWDWDWTEVIKLSDEFHANSDFEEEIRATLNDGTDGSQ
ncbi:hypothetical protein C8R45DRAFT_1218534 [Mycena sanguinolenta]|nr:hypothetical protein C8R45DRAFT_1218534 [Mycena sanguinolenta]